MTQTAHSHLAEMGIHIMYQIMTWCFTLYIIGGSMLHSIKAKVLQSCKQASRQIRSCCWHFTMFLFRGSFRFSKRTVFDTNGGGGTDVWNLQLLTCWVFFKDIFWSCAVVRQDQGTSLWKIAWPAEIWLHLFMKFVMIIWFKCRWWRENICVGMSFEVIL